MQAEATLRLGVARLLRRLTGTLESGVVDFFQLVKKRGA